MPAFDPLSKQPELKHSAVRLEPALLPWHLFALIEGDIQQNFETLRPLCEAFSYVSFSLAGRERPALVIRAASASASDPQLLRDIDAWGSARDRYWLTTTRAAPLAAGAVDTEASRRFVWLAKPWHGTGCKTSGRKAGPTSNCAAGCWHHWARHRATPTPRWAVTRCVHLQERQPERDR